MTCNDAGLALIKSFEGLRLEAYQDTRGIWTIGCGHTGSEVVQGLVWTEDQAMQQFTRDVMICAEQPLDSAINVPLNSNQFSSLCSLVFNIGARSFKGSHLCAILNDNDYDNVPDEFIKWCHNHDGSVNNGLLRRRRAEVDLWNTDC